eukprot:scaffold33752_cov56-Phaeocystis_antarctica.AAC.2
MCVEVEASGKTWLSLVRSVQKPGAPRDWTILTSPDHTPTLPSCANVDTLAPPITGSFTVSQVVERGGDGSGGGSVHALGPIPAIVAVGAAAHVRRLEQRLAVCGRRSLLGYTFLFCVAPLVAARWAAAVVELDAVAEAHVAVRGQLIGGRERQSGEETHEHQRWMHGEGAQKGCVRVPSTKVRLEISSTSYPPTRAHSRGALHYTHADLARHTYAAHSFTSESSGPHGRPLRQTRATHRAPPRAAVCPARARRVGPSGASLREEEAPLALVDGGEQPLAHDLLGRVVGQLEVVGARHHARQVGVRRVAALGALLHYRQARHHPGEAAHRQAGAAGHKLPHTRAPRRD